MGKEVQIFTSFWSLRRVVFKFGSEFPKIWSNEAWQNIKFQATNLKVSGVIEIPGVRCQDKENIQTETCWSEAEIPSDVKRQRGTL